MLFTETPLSGAFVIEVEKLEDSRGSFARLFCAEEFRSRNLESNYVQSNVSHNNQSGTVRGMHFQKGAAAEVKLVRCISGRIFDVIVDLRPDSTTYLQSYGIELTFENEKSMYVPRGFAHGYQALTPGATIHYMVSQFYSPSDESGLRHDDPVLGIKWPIDVSNISLKDSSWPFITI